MRHLTYIAFFEVFARSYNRIRHGEPGSQYPTGQRHSFFRMNANGELLLSESTQVDYPVMKLPAYFGQLKQQAGTIEDVMTGVVEFCGQVSDPFDFEAIEQCRDQCKQMCLELAAYLHYIQEENGYCGPLGKIDINSARYDFTGPSGNNNYGCRLSFQFSREAFNPFQFNPDTILST